MSDRYVTLLSLSAFCVGIPVLVGWAKWRLWEWRADKGLP